MALLKSILNYFNICIFIFSDSNPLLQSEDIKVDLTTPRSFLVQRTRGFPSESCESRWVSEDQAFFLRRAAACVESSSAGEGLFALGFV